MHFQCYRSVIVISGDRWRSDSRESEAKSDSVHESVFIASTGLSGDHRVLDPPDPIPNSVVKRYIADGSVGSPHVRVGHRQTLISTDSM